MSNLEKMVARRDAYYDIRGAVRPFISPWWNNLVENLTEEDAQAEVRSLYEEFADDDHTFKEISFLFAMAV